MSAITRRAGVAAVLAVCLAYRDDRRFIDDDPLAGYENEHIRGPEVNTKLWRKEGHCLHTIKW